MKRELLARAIFVATFALLTAGCWSTNYSSDTSGLPPPDRPRVEDHVKEPPGWVGNPIPGPTEMPGSEDGDCHTTVLDGPITIHLRKHAPRNRLLAERAVVRLDLPVGYDRKPIGLAEMTAMAVSETADGAGNRPSMRQAITRLGGDLTVEVGKTWTTFTCRVPSIDWEESLRAIVERLHRQPMTHANFADLQDRLIHANLTAWRESPLLSQAAAWLRHGDRPYNEIVEGVQDRNLAEVVLFQRRHYQPRGVSIGVWVPGAPDDPSFLLERAKGALVAWEKEPVPRRVGAQSEPILEPSGVKWVEADGKSRVALVLPLSDVSSETWTLIETLTMDGLGGRIGELLEKELERDLVFRVHEIGNYGDRYLILYAEVEPHEVVKLWTAAQTAWKSLGESPPLGGELGIALLRTRLRLLRRQDLPDAWLEAASLRRLQRKKGGPAGDLEELSRVSSSSLIETAKELSSKPIAMVVIGGGVPPDAPADFQKVEVEIPDYSRPTTADIEASEEKARPYLQVAMQALGETRHFTLFRGFELRETWRTGKDLETEVEVSTRFQTPDKLSRSSRFLGTEIVTDIQGTSGRERLGDQTKKLETGEAAQILSEASRHPVALLSAYAQEKSRYRLIGTRTRRGRRGALLELIDATQSRLRITIDIESGLLRTVETTQRRPEIGLVQILDWYDDYRTQEGLRVPMHRLTTVDNSLEGVDSKVESFKLYDR